MAESVLTPRALNRALLARQMLLERTCAPIPEVVERMGGLQMQYAPSAYIGLWSRIDAFRRESLTTELELRAVTQATLMRATIHLVSARDYWPLASATRGPRKDWLTRTMRRQLETIDLDAVEARLRELLDPGPLRQAEIQARMTAAGWPRIGWVSVAHWTELVRVPPSGTWASRKADLYGLAEKWLGPRPGSFEEMERAGRELLVRRYLGAFGPAPLPDVAAWAGVPAPLLRPALETLPLRRFRDEEGRELLDLTDAPLPHPDTPAPVRFLPTWDAILLVHARRTRVLPEEYRPLVFDTKTPHSVPTFLVDGQVAGKWAYEKGRVRIEPFAPLPPAANAELELEADRLAAFHR